MHGLHQMTRITSPRGALKHDDRTTSWPSQREGEGEGSREFKERFLKKPRSRTGSDRWVDTDLHCRAEQT